MEVTGRWSPVPRGFCALFQKGDMKLVCGIVGYIGNKEAQDILTAGLKKLEYRGYDSAGVAVYNGERIQVKRTEGRLAALEGMLERQRLPGKVGVGHTRWATHGKPSDHNAHPHVDNTGKIAVVHNGIIENYLPLKEELTSKGHTFVSDTDTEVIAHLLADLYDGDMVTAVQQAVKRLEGAFALAIVTEYEPDRVIAVRQASPLVVGVGNGEHYVASDIPALLPYTRHVYVLEDGEMAVLTKDNVQLLTTDGTPIRRNVQEVKWDVTQAERGGFDHFMQKEIYEQPQSIRDTLGSRIDENGNVDIRAELSLSDRNVCDIDRVHIVACGTASYAGMVGKGLLEQLVRVPVEWDIASEYRYKGPIFTENTLVIVVSQSGETADTLAALREAQRNGARVLAITNVVGSSIAREADDVLYTWAGPEIAVASTKAYTSQLIAFYLMALHFARVRGALPQEQLVALAAQLRQLPEHAERLLAQAGKLREMALKIAHHEHVFYIGRGLDYAVSLEGSLKLKEISYIHSEAYAAGELKHGTLALIEEGTPVIALATQQALFGKTLSNVKEVKARGAYVIGLRTEGNGELDSSVDDILEIPDVHPLLTPPLSVVLLQLLAYYTAVFRGNDVDKPRNLAKSVTVE